MRHLSLGEEHRCGRSRSQTLRSAMANRPAAWIVGALVCALACGGTAASAGAETATYSATQTIPIPPASNFAGSGGGDGWAVALSETAVYNVFHHESYLGVDCHLQANAEPCWSPETRTIKEGNANFSTSGHPGMYLDRHTGRLYVYATRSSDATAGVVCVDTEEAPTNENPFCGFTELTQKGEAPLIGISGVSNPMLIGTRWYAFSFANGVGQVGEKNKLLCFDVSTDAACAGQPYTVEIGPGTVSDGGFPSPATAAIGSKVIVPLAIEGTNRLACFDDTTQSTCAGSWPVTLKTTSYAGYNGAPFPLLEATGKLAGLCIPTGTDECFNLQGEETATPAEMPSVIKASDGWNGPAFVLGPRVYLPNGTTGQSGAVECFDYATGAGCANFPKEFEELGYLYTVNKDPQRPTCIWVNSDYGSHQIQNFDAYTGAECGQGTIRVLASQFVVAEPQCTPASYISLQVLKPARNTYSTGSVAFADGDGNPIGLEERTLDETGTASLAGLELNTPTGLPQFLFTLGGENEEIGAVEIKLTWTGDYDASCVGENATVTTTPPPTPTPQPTPTPAPAGGVAAFKTARLAGHAKACIASRTYRASVSGSSIASVTFKVNGHRVAKRTKPNSHGKYTTLIKLRAGHKKKLVVRVTYTKASGSAATKIKRTLARCAVHHRKTPRFTG
jgi:hypothetical protein